MGNRMCSRELPQGFEGGIVGKHAYGSQAAVLIFREPSGYRYTFSKDDGQYILSDDASSSPSGRRRRAVFTGEPTDWRQSSSAIRISIPGCNERALFELLGDDGSLILGRREYRWKYMDSTPTSMTYAFICVGAEHDILAKFHIRESRMCMEDVTVKICQQVEPRMVHALLFGVALKIRSIDYQGYKTQFLTFFDDQFHY